jgi:hypothetical protein
MPLLRQAIAAVITFCQELQLPLAHEKLDFGNKKLANNGKKPNELLNMMPTAVLAQVIALPAGWRRGTPGRPGLHLDDRCEIRRLRLLRPPRRGGRHRPACRRIQLPEKG